MTGMLGVCWPWCIASLLPCYSMFLSGKGFFLILSFVSLHHLLLPSSLPPPSLPPRPPSYTGMPMILSYTANHYENAFANGQTCAGVNTPFNSSERAFAAKNTNALSVRRSQLKVR